MERHVRALGVRGFVDLLYRHLVFEFKRDLALERASGLAELKRYLSAIPHGDRIFGILTDGKRFEAHMLTDPASDLRCVDTFELDAADPDAARLSLDCYLFAESMVPPTAEDMVRRFGERSPVFAATIAALTRLFNSVRSLPPIKTKFGEWENLLAHVYGSPVGTEELFIRHTYLALLARLLAYTALRGQPPPADALAGIMDGSAFGRFGISNLAEGDFFAWVLEEPIAADALSAFRGLLAHLRVYDLQEISEDVLKELYQHLVDPDTRHDLGEYYTPDWLAERTLREAGFRPGKSLLDPACGSGTFLFTAIRLLREAGLRGEHLIRFAFENLAGLDVHPLAVMIAKVNFVLALLPDLRNLTVTNLPPLPIFMADTLNVPTEANDPAIRISVHTLDPREALPNGVPSEFMIPRRVVQIPTHLDQIINRMAELAGAAAPEDQRALTASIQNFVRELGYGDVAFYFAWDFSLLCWLVQSKRDSVWAFILRNAYRPAYFAERKFDLVAGNPPWLTYRSIASPQYRRVAKELILKYGLASPRDTHVFTDLDISTLFFAHCARHFLRPGGTIAFVMPRSVLTGAKQHARFQELYIPQRILDLQQVEPLFNTPACVLVLEPGTMGRTPTAYTRILGVLPRKNASTQEARERLVEHHEQFQFPRRPAGRSPYHAAFALGANIVPRCFWFVRPSEEALVLDAGRPQLETDPSFGRHAKRPWATLRLQGAVERQFLYATAIGEDLVPFGVRHFRLVILPMMSETQTSGTISVTRNTLLTPRSALESGYPGLANWLMQAESLWELNKRPTTRETLLEWLDYQGKLRRQTPSRGFKVLYNKSGTHLASCVVDAATPIHIHGLLAAGFVADYVTYVASFDDPEEAHYLAALLNAPSVNAAIKEFQPRGLFGAQRGAGQRDITRLPFEVVPIPRFNPQDERHLQLAHASQTCHERVAALLAEDGALRWAATGRARRRVREALRAELERIDSLARSLLQEPHA